MTPWEPRYAVICAAAIRSHLTTAVRRRAFRTETGNLPVRVMIDASHGNSGKDFAASRRRGRRLQKGAGGQTALAMLESFLVDAGRTSTGPTGGLWSSVTTAAWWDLSESTCALAGAVQHGDGKSAASSRDTSRNGRATPQRLRESGHAHAGSGCLIERQDIAA